MAAIVPDLPSSSSLCTPDSLLIKPPAPLFSLPFSSSLPLFFFYLQLSESGRRRCNSPLSIRRRHDLLSSLAPCDHRSGALSRLGKTEGALFRELSIPEPFVHSRRKKKFSPSIVVYHVVALRGYYRSRQSASSIRSFKANPRRVISNKRLERWIALTVSGIDSRRNNGIVFDENVSLVSWPDGRNEEWVDSKHRSNEITKERVIRDVSRVGRETLSQGIVL